MKREGLTFIDPAPFLKLADRPEWLLGGEEGANQTRTQFEQEEILFGLTALTFYSEFNASMGIQLLYNIASSIPQVVCERLFYPEIRVERFLRKHNLPLFSLESKLAAHNFDILAFSIFHIPEYLNLLETFDLCGLPYKAEERLEGKHPLVIGGGIFSLNPEPIAPFFDVICIGEGDDWLKEFLEFYKKNRSEWESGDPTRKRLFLELLSSIEGTYVPILTGVTYEDDKERIIRWTTTPSQITIRKRICDITRQDSTLLKRTIMSRTEKEAFTKAIEVARGCRHKCRFCVVTAFYSPYRERPFQVLKEIIDFRKSLGLKQIGVGAPTPPDYSHISELANYIISEGLRFDIQSERMDTFSFESARAHVLSGRGNVSLAIEAPDDLTRRQINKNLPEQVIMDAVSNGLRAGFRGIKLMFMLCHPWETPENAKQFEPLLTKLFKLREELHPGTFYRVSVCPFIPKPWTTFQWAPLREAPALFAAANDAIESARRTPTGAHRFALQFAGGPTSRWFDTVFSRGDRRLSDVFILVHQNGVPANEMLYEFPYGAATKHCISLIKGFCMNLKLPLDKWLNGSSLEADLPWDFIDIGIKKKWLQEDWKRAEQGIENVSCNKGCAGCGACETYADMNIPHATSYPEDHFKLDVTFQQFIKAKSSSRAIYPRRLVRVIYKKNDKAVNYNFQDFRRIVRRCFETAGYDVDLGSIESVCHLFEGGMRWTGIDWCDIWTYLPLDIQPDGLMKSIIDSWNLELGEILEVRLCDQGLGVGLQGVVASMNVHVEDSEIKKYWDIPSIDIVRAEHVTEKKSGEGVKSEHLNIKDFLLDMYSDVDGTLIMEIALNGSAVEFLQTLLKIDRKSAERFNVCLEEVIVKESWEK